MAAPKITELLFTWQNGDESAFEKLYPLIEHELRRIARSKLKHERNKGRLQTTELINEAFLRMTKGERAWQSRVHFFAMSAKVMRNILVNFARDANTEKRGGRFEHIDLEEAAIVSPERGRELIDLDDALKRLSALSSVKGQIVELRYFGGLNIDETAEVLGISASSVSLHWRLARAWLQNQLDAGVG